MGIINFVFESKAGALYCVLVGEQLRRRVFNNLKSFATAGLIEGWEVLQNAAW